MNNVNIELMSKKQLADAFQVHPRTVQRWTKQYAGFPHFYISNKLFFEFSAVLNFWKTRK